MNPELRTNAGLVVVMIPVLALVAMMQGVLGPRLAILDAKPNGILLLVLIWTQVRGRREGMFMGLIGGFWLDFLSLSTLGFSSLALVLTSFLTGLGRRNVLATHILVPTWLAVLGTLTYSTIFNALLAAFHTTLVWTAEFRDLLAVQVLFQMVAMLLLTPLLYSLLRRRPATAEIHVG